MTKCRQLLQENEDLGKIISSGNVAQLEHDLAYHKQLINEASSNEQNINSFLLEIDNQMDLMHATISKLNDTKTTNEEVSIESSLVDNVIAENMHPDNNEKGLNSEKMEDT
jgi:hypothetical protein